MRWSHAATSASTPVAGRQGQIRNRRWPDSRPVYALKSKLVYRISHQAGQLPPPRSRPAARYRNRVSVAPRLRAGMCAPMRVWSSGYQLLLAGRITVRWCVDSYRLVTRRGRGVWMPQVLVAWDCMLRCVASHYRQTIVAELVQRAPEQSAISRGKGLWDGQPERSAAEPLVDAVATRTTAKPPNRHCARWAYGWESEVGRAGV